MVSDAAGTIRPDSTQGHGLWIGDTRHLSNYVLHVNGEEPPIAAVVRSDPGSLRFEGIAAGLHVFRERYVADGLHERITLTNSGPAAVTAEFELTAASDSADMMAIRGMAAALGPPRARDAEITSQPPGLRHRVHLGAGDRFSIVIAVGGPQDFDVGLARIRDAYRRWAADCAHIETDNPAINELLQRSRDDLRMLLDFYPTGIYPTGGIPWYAVPFGRDGLITALFTLPLNPEIARGTLRFLAAHQGRAVDAAAEEQPGKILHEVRTGETVRLGLWPPIFYGDVDASALLICTLGETLDWTGDLDLFEELWPHAEAALEWCERYGDADGDGYIECYTGRGRNQSWKDADDSLTHDDGTDASGQAALCEAQGYLYRALLTMARKRPELRQRAAELKRRFNQDFWVARKRYVAQGLDRSKRPVEAVSSNPGHCLWSSILTPDVARAVASRLVSPDLFSGWGIRTLSSEAINYDPHNGSNGCVVPFDNAFAAAGLGREGFVREAELVARSMLEAGAASPLRRITEVLSGVERVDQGGPEEIYDSCGPQSWSAAAMFSLVGTVLGLSADASAGQLHVAPRATPLWSRVEVFGLHFAGHRIDFAVEDSLVKMGAVPKGVTVEP